VRAQQVDHIDPIGGDLSRLFERENLQALCASCHARKTATTLGAHGRN
jgi:5-methylcytosine-specific restriction protein A